MDRSGENVGKPRFIRHVSVGCRGCAGQQPKEPNERIRPSPGANNLTKAAPSDSDYSRGGAELKIAWQAAALAARG
jgi:hypothetical protein